MPNSPMNKRTISLLAVVVISLLSAVFTIYIYDNSPAPNHDKSEEIPDRMEYSDYNVANTNSVAPSDIITKVEVDNFKRQFSEGNFLVANIIATYYHSVGDEDSWVTWKERGGSRGSCLALSDLEAYYSNADNAKAAQRSNSIYVKYNCNKDKSSKESEKIRNELNRF